MENEKSRINEIISDFDKNQEEFIFYAELMFDEIQGILNLDVLEKEDLEILLPILTWENAVKLHSIINTYRVG